MKKLLLPVFFIVITHSVTLAQNCNDDFLGTKTLYNSTKQQYTAVPVGYRPVFINHVGRHGARHLTKDVSTTLAYALLFKADSLNALTDKGKQLKEMVNALQKVEKGNTKSISAEGQDELAGLGQRMYLNYSNVFAGKPNLNIAITKEVRTKQSADAFLQGLSNSLKDPDAINEYNDDTDLRFYDLSPAYKSFEKSVDESDVTLSLRKAEGFDALNKAVISRFFNVDFLAKLDDKQQAKFVADVFGFTTIVYSLQTEIQQAGFKSENLDFKQFFTCDELHKFGLFDSDDEDLKKGPGTDNNGIQVRVAVPLLVNFINTTDEFIKDGKFNAQLRFAHAETVAPFAALLQIANADEASTDAAKLNEVWKAADVIPLSANIQWVFYRKQGSADYLVKVLLNEKEMYISGLNKKSFPYYSWNDLRALYINKLNKLNVKLTDDMNAYLSNLK